jgi:hypothetical protein
MEDMKQLLIPPVKEQIRLLLVRPLPLRLLITGNNDLSNQTRTYLTARSVTKSCGYT